jgi:hypothetical protein
MAGSETSRLVRVPVVIKYYVVLWAEQSHELPEVRIVLVGAHFIRQAEVVISSLST